MSYKLKTLSSELTGKSFGLNKSSIFCVDYYNCPNNLKSSAAQYLVHDNSTYCTKLKFHLYIDHDNSS